MKAVVKLARGDGFVEEKDVPEPEPARGEVKIRVRAASVCGSDVHIFHDEHPYWPPMILGHEFSGEIAGLGEGVEGWKPGDRVVTETRTGSCGRCEVCMRGAPQNCPHKRPPGIGRDGAFAEYVVMPASLLHRIPEGVGYEEAAVVEPAAVCYHALVERTGVLAGDVVVVIGPGPIGLLSLLLARLSGAAKVIVSGTPRSAGLKLKKAHELGADRTVNIGEESLEDAAMEETKGVGADLVVECAGKPGAISDAFKCVRRLGRIAALAIAGKEVQVPWDAGVFKAPVLTYCFSSSWTAWEAVLRLLGSGRLRLSPLITHTAPLGDWKEIFGEIEAGRAIKTILRP